MKTKIELIRNATMKITYAGKIILTDPYFAEKGTLPGYLDSSTNVNPTRELPLTKENILNKVEMILVSHTHIPVEDVPAPPSDHFDQVAVDFISKDFPIFTQPFDIAGLNRVGFRNITEIESSIDFEGITITRFNGKHVDIDALLPVIGESSGYVLQAENQPTILWTGDTILTDELRSAITDYNPDIIITHSGGAQLLIDEHGNVATLLLDADATIEIANLAPKAKIIAIHMESLDHCPVTKDELRSKAIQAGVSDRILIPENGEVIEF